MTPRLPLRLLPALLLSISLVGQAADAPRPFTAGPAIDAAIEKAIAAGKLPGAVVLAGQPGRVLYHKAYGARAIDPSRETMTEDTIFDIASLTKVIATTSAMMKLEEQGKVRMSDRVNEYLPGFQGGKSEITVRQLMTHFSGLREDLDLNPAWSGYKTGIDKAYAEVSRSAPGDRFVYSDINFILLGEIVRVVSGRPLNEFVEQEVFAPLGMKETRFNPPAEWRARIAPTEKVEGHVLRGVVHDETARFMGGVAGHAGLFSTAADLSRFAEMMLGMGEREGVRVFSPLTVRKFTSPNTPPNQTVLRGLGWDIDSPFSGNRGELFPLGSYGHTGFTGTSIWIDPSTKTYVILLANAVHPARKGAITALRGQVATIVAAGVGIDVQGSVISTMQETAQGTPRRVTARTVETLTGADVLAADGFAKLKGKRVGLITNHTGLLRDGRRVVDAMVASGVNVTALFSPEHGLQGKEDHENIANSRDQATGITIWSLYAGKTRKPAPEALKECDVLVFDIQDIGARFYTYISTLKNVMQAAVEAKLPLVVLDRPNPLNGVAVEGAILDDELRSFIGPSALPLRHGLTMGEMARWFKTYDLVDAQLDVVAMKNWTRADWWDATTLTWIDPSPNMRSFNAALLYPGVGMLEFSKNWSVGRGTDAPFEQVGADWVNGAQLAAALNRRFIPGVRVYATRFTPASSYFKDKRIEGVRFVVTDREAFSSFRLGLEIAYAVQKLYPGKIDFEANAKLIGNRTVIRALNEGVDPKTIEELQRKSVTEYVERRKAVLLYQ